MELFGVLTALVIAASISLLRTMLLGIINNQVLGLEASAIGVVGGMFAGTLPRVFFRKAILLLIISA